MKKKFLALLAVVTLTFSAFAGCSSSDSSSSASGSGQLLLPVLLLLQEKLLLLAKRSITSVLATFLPILILMRWVLKRCPSLLLKNQTAKLLLMFSLTHS